MLLDSLNMPISSAIGNFHNDTKYPYLPLLEIIPYVEASEAMFRSVLEILSRHANAL